MRDVKTLGQLTQALRDIRRSLSSAARQPIRDVAKLAAQRIGNRIDSGIGPDVAERTREQRRGDKQAPALEDTMALFNAVTAIDPGAPYSVFETTDTSLTIGVSGKSGASEAEFGSAHEPQRQFLPTDDAFWDDVIRDADFARKFRKEAGL